MKNVTLSALLVLTALPWAAKAQTDDEDAAQGEAPAEDGAPIEGRAPVVDQAAADEDLEDEADDAEERAAAVEPPQAPEPGGVLSAPAQNPTQPALQEDLEAEAADRADAEEEGAAAAPPAQLPWRNTFFTWGHGVTFNSFFRNSQLSYNPFYSQSFTLSPRWYVGPATFLIASQSLGIELTDSDGEALNHDPQLTDTIVELRHLLPLEGFVFQGQARIGLPLSKASQAAQRYFQAGLGLTVIRAIPEIGLTLAVQGAYRRWFAGSNVLQVGDALPDNCAPTSTPTGPTVGSGAPEINDVTCDQLGTPSSGRDNILAGLSVVWNPLPELSISASYFMFFIYGFELAPVYYQADNWEEPRMIADGSPTHWRNLNNLSISVGYQFTSWLNVAIGITNHGVWASNLSPDGSVRNPIFTPDTQVNLSATVQLDTVYTELSGSGDDGLTPEERQRRRQGLAAAPTRGGAF